MAHLGPLRLFVPAWSTLDVGSLLLAAVAMLAMLRFRVGLMPTPMVAALVGLAWRSFVA